MQKSSVAVSIVATAALAAGSVGMAFADGTHRAGHHHSGIDGSVGENTALAPPLNRGELPKLVGIVNADRDIEISDRTPEPGRYKIVVRDSTNRHNWHLFGNGKSIKTTVRGVDRWVFTIRLTAGNYRVVCDPHFDDMEFDLIVG